MKTEAWCKAWLEPATLVSHILQGRTMCDSDREIAAALESPDSVCGHTDPSAVDETKIILALAQSIGPDAPITGLRAFRHITNVHEMTLADSCVIRSVAERIGALLADVVMQSHGIPLGESGIPIEETKRREQIRETLMNHVADEILAGN